jgi:ABC-type phosphate transport system substrate-binding protein
MRLPKAIFPAILTLVFTAMPVIADVVVVVSSKSTITILSKSQIADIFLGKTARFPDGSPAVPVDQSEGTLARDGFYSAFTGESAAQLKAHWSKIIFTGRGQPPKAVPNSLALKTLVAENPAAIGYIEATFVDETLRVVKVIGQ